MFFGDMGDNVFVGGGGAEVMLNETQNEKNEMLSNYIF